MAANRVVTRVAVLSKWYQRLSTANTSLLVSTCRSPARSGSYNKLVSPLSVETLAFKADRHVLVYRNLNYVCLSAHLNADIPCPCPRSDRETAIGKIIPLPYG